MSNYPAGFTQLQHDRIFTSDDRQPNQQACFMCGRVIEQDDATGRWFDPDEYVDYKPSWRDDFLDSFPTEQGWACSTSCFNENAIDAGEPATSGIHLVKGGRA
jgi:hypothetical protein